MLTASQKEAQIEIDNYRDVVRKLLALVLVHMESTAGGLIIHQERGGVVVMDVERIRKYLHEKRHIPIVLGDL